MATTIGLPSLTITFQAAAQQAANRSKKGYVGVFVRDAKAQGVHQLSSAALIPTELGQENQNYIRRAFTGSDRAAPARWWRWSSPRARRTPPPWRRASRALRG